MLKVVFLSCPSGAALKGSMLDLIKECVPQEGFQLEAKNN